MIIEIILDSNKKYGSTKRVAKNLSFIDEDEAAKWCLENIDHIWSINDSMPLINATEKDIKRALRKRTVHVERIIRNGQKKYEKNVETIIDADKIKKAMQVLIDNGIDKEDAGTVLNALGYTLLDTHLDTDGYDIDKNNKLTYYKDGVKYSVV